MGPYAGTTGTRPLCAGSGRRRQRQHLGIMWTSMMSPIAREQQYTALVVNTDQCGMALAARWLTAHTAVPVLQRNTHTIASHQWCLVQAIVLAPWARWPLHFPAPPVAFRPTPAPHWPPSAARAAALGHGPVPNEHRVWRSMHQTRRSCRRRHGGNAASGVPEQSRTRMSEALVGYGMGRSARFGGSHTAVLEKTRA